MNPYFLFDSYSSYKDIVDNYIDGQILYYFDNSGTKYTINTLEAFKYPFKKNTIWEEVIFDNLKTYQIVPQDNSKLKYDDIHVTESGMMSFPKAFKVTYPTDNKKPIPTKIKAKFQTKIPSNIYQFRFLKTDLGKTQAKNNVSVTLLNIKNGYVEIEVITPENFIENEDACDQYYWLVIEAKDSTSQYISMSTASNHQWVNGAVLGHLYKELTNQISYTPEFVSDFLKKTDKIFEDEKVLYETRDKNKHYRFQLFNGVVKEINVDIYDYSASEFISKEVIYPISDFRNLITLGDLKKISTTASVYDNESTILANKPYDIPEYDLKNQITTNQIPALISKGAVVSFIYPNLISSKIIGDFERFNKLKEIAFLDKNEKPIEISSDSIGFSPNTEKNKLVDFTVNRINYQYKRFSEIPYYIKGIFELNIADVKKQTYRIDNLPEGVLIKENAVILDTRLYKMNKYVVFVKDRTDRYIKQIYEYSGAVEIDGEKLNKHVSYYYGTPQTIEIYTITKTKTVDYNFKVKLTREESNESMTMWN